MCYYGVNRAPSDSDASAPHAHSADSVGFWDIFAEWVHLFKGRTPTDLKDKVRQGERALWDVVARPTALV
jgi:hypothetical protein